MVRVGVIGCGYWGPNLIRNFFKVQACQVTMVADVVPERLAPVARLYPGVQTSTDPEMVLASDTVDAVAIATPISSHHALAREALARGKHVLIEKPITATAAEAEDLVALAASRERILMVDHTFIYTGAVRKIRELIRSGALGDVYYYDAVRVNLGLLQQDVNVLWDLAPHDFSILMHLLEKDPVRITAIGAAPVRWDGWRRESIVYVTMEFTDATLAHFHLNWLSPVKIRRTLIGGSRRIVVYDHLDPDNQVKIFDRGVEILSDRDRYHALVQYRTGDMLVPKIDQTEALEVVCHHFVECVVTGRQPLSDGRAGLQVVKLLEAAQRSLEENRTLALA